VEEAAGVVVVVAEAGWVAELLLLQVLQA